MVKIFHTTCIAMQQQCEQLSVQTATQYTNKVKTTIAWYILKSEKNTDA